MPGQVGPGPVPSGGTIGGSGTANKVAKFTGAAAIGNSTITDTGTVVTVAAITKVGADGAPNSNNTLYAGDNSLEPFGWGSGATQYGQLTYGGAGATIIGVSTKGVSIGANGAGGDITLDTSHNLGFGSNVAAVTFGNAAYQSCTALTTNGAGLLICTASDERLKDIHGPSAEGLDAILQITPQKFEWKDGRREGIQAGLIAQDVQRAIPLGVSENGEGYLQLQPDAITGALINAIKELHATVRDLQNQVAVLSKK